MATMFFGQYLLAKGVIDRDALLDALDRQRRSNLSLPDLAVRDGLIERSRADAIMAQYRMSDDRIEDILASAGGLDADQIRRLQSKQRSSWLRIGAALVEGGYLSDEAIAANLEDYRSLESAADEEIRDAMRHLPNADAVGACVELTMFHFGRVSGRPTKLGSITREPDRLETGRQRFSQRIVGDGDYTIALDLPPVLIAAVARGMLGFDVDPGTETEADAVCEVINLIGGNACTRIEQFGQVLRPEPPVWSGTGGLVSSSTDSVRATVSSAESGFDIRVFTAGSGD
ncbi:MAG: chemotaxis protein CheC [Candidatus Sulfomarinibacteraceae bacterium]